MKTLSQCTVGIIGLGQMGGSLALDLTRRRAVASVRGFDIDSEQMFQAVSAKALDRSCRDMVDVMTDCDLVILATPIRVTIDILPEIARLVASQTVVIDLTGVKEPILEVVSTLDPDFQFVAGHPMAGNEGEGFLSVRPDQFNNATFVLMPAAGLRPDSLELARQLVLAVGANPVSMSPERHDESVALTCHLPYALAVLLLDMARERATQDPEVWRLVAGSLRDATRVAGSSVELTVDMFRTNRARVSNMIGQLTRRLDALRHLLDNDDAEALSDLARQAQRTRLQNILGRSDASEPDQPTF